MAAKTDFVFCPKEPDGGTKGALNTWRMCRRFPSCRIVSAEAGGERVEVQCGKDVVVLEVENGRTLLRTPQGDREVAPHPMKIGPANRPQDAGHREGIEKATHVATGKATSCAIVEGGRLSCWGEGRLFKKGSAPADTNTPVEIRAD